MEKVSNGIKFARWQVPIWLIYVGTVQRSQGMTLGRAVIDLKTHFWEYGQLYVAISIITEPDNLCFLLSGSSDLRREIDPTETPIRVRIDVVIVQIISRLYSGVGADHVVSADVQPPSIGSSQRHNSPCRSDFLINAKAKWITWSLFMKGPKRVLRINNRMMKSSDLTRQSR
jgi:hypothetical protein